MSSSGDDDLSKFNFPGGFPSSKDLAPSIVFLIAYVIATPLLIYRLIKKDTRCVPLIRPTIFASARYAMLILRAVMSKNNYGESELIGELILTSIGTLFLIEPMVDLWKRNVATAVRMDVAPKWVQHMARLLQLGVMGAIVTAIVSSAKISDAINDPSELGTVMDLKKASSCITLAVVVITAGAALITHVTFGLAIRNTAFILGCELCLAVISIYRLVQTFSLDPTTAVHKPVVFWICQMVFEYIVFVALIAIPIPAWFPSTKSQASKEGDNLVPIDNRKYGGGYPVGQAPQYPPRPYNGNSQA